MSHYASDTARPAKTLTEAEQKQILRVSGEHVRGFRDHLILAFALGTGLREHEIAALNVGDVFHPDGRPRRRFPLRVYKRSAARPAPQEVIVPDDLLYKLEKLWAYKQRAAEPLTPDAPVFLSRHGKRIATRTLRHLFAVWQERAGLERRLNFHQLRHTACTNLYRRHRDPTMVQRFARHTSLKTTSIYMHPDDEEMMQAIRLLPC